MAKLWRDICNPELVETFNVLIDTQMQILITMEKTTREILKDIRLDYDSISYFKWLLSTTLQMRATLEKEYIFSKTSPQKNYTQTKRRKK